MKLPYRPVVALAAALTLGLAGCASDEGSDADGGSDSAGDVCANLEAVSNFEMESNETIPLDPTDWPAMRNALIEYRDGLSEYYDSAIEAADGEVEADLTLVRDASIESVQLASESETVEKFQELAADVDMTKVAEAQEASVRLDRFAVDNCDYAKQAADEQEAQQQLQQQQLEQQQQPGQPQEQEQPAG